MKLKLQLGHLLFALVLLTATSAQNLYTGVWRSGTDNYALYGGLNWSSFTSKWSSLASQNLRLVDVSTYMSNGTRYYNGVWRAGTDGYALYNGVNWDDFVAEWSALAKKNLRLIDIEIYMQGSTRVYLGVWRAGTDGYALVNGLNWTGFVAQWSDLAKKNLRLIDVASYVVNGTRLYAGVWRAGTDGYALYNGLDATAFTAKWNELAAQNLRLINVSSYLQNNKRLYIGVWRSGTDGYALWDGTDWESTTSKWAELGAANLRLINLETYETTCDASCLNHVLMPDDLSTDGRDTYNYHITAGKYHCEGKPGTCPLPNPGDYVEYRWPNLQIGNNYYARNSTLFGAKDQIFTLPFKEAASAMGHNGWRYSTGVWHHAIDYYRNDGSTFQVCAAAPGKVIYVGWDYWSGNTMVISHDVGLRKDAYRTIYMHLQNGPSHDCSEAWNSTVPLLKDTKEQKTKTNYIHYLNSTGCPESVSLRDPDVPHWGKESQKIKIAVNTKVKAGQVIAWAGSAGPGGCGCTDGTTNTNTHLHVFFAYRDPTDNHWYFFDPYGIYSEPYCYPTGVSDAINGQCARYPIAWKYGKPSYATTSFDETENLQIITDVKTSKVSVMPNPSQGNITAQYNTETGGKIHISVFNKTGLLIYEKEAYAIRGNNSYPINLSNVLPGVYYVEIQNGLNKAKNNFIISR